MAKNTARVRISRNIYLVLAFIFLSCVAVQIFLAGMAIFITPAHWMNHIFFIHLFGFNLPVLMLLFALAGAMPRWAYWQLFGIFFLVFLMYFTANITGSLPWAGAMHPVIAVLLFLLSWKIVRKSITFIRKNNQ
ncbi:DUF6220 domain-containing protein [Thalassobacillus pellis]|uniref:DUF6220 domain-containing protein n=1 Tax=Thalassobacillus pellis TaxID=748008 RepID=UPI0019613020|nr:DUF6220 domain-containing protein [Thalassobacillus pellis]MBM7554227.1 hypothetical protein [Thalassobacillus pellis]